MSNFGMVEWNNENRGFKQMGVYKHFGKRFKQKIVVIDYGAGNVRSVGFALERLGIEPVITNKPEVIKGADKVIFPGVGEAGSAMKRLMETGLDRLIPELKQPVLGICLGMQLMGTFSEEGKTRGLGILPFTVQRFNHSLKIPHMGWNRVFHLKDGLFNGIEVESYLYFVHSYYVPNNEYSIATTDYGFEFSSAVRFENFYAVQFHPEKSGETGSRILENFLK